MSVTVDEIYLNIAQGIASAIEGDWEEAYIFSEILEDAANFKGEYTTGSDKKYFEVADEAFDNFEELHRITTEGNNNKWNRAKFTLTPDGKFHIDFEWDQSLANEIQANS
ncbi:immunity protein YezG family protein [Amphritea pacifica]|uniref:immunity protein YezG family protein n=1 Tax=Amphritea pacifica TaxID=2811233 RepID=UPI0019664E33|nr:immunity protein YezG family protein [Amphritea pacifica]MBN1008240.1 DUF600 family protein [Amphritea pacifica]